MTLSGKPIWLHVISCSPLITNIISGMGPEWCSQLHSSNDKCLSLECVRESTVGVATLWGPGGSWFELRLGRNFPHPSRPPPRPTPTFCTGLFISPSGNSELDCATTKTDTAERSISMGRESLKAFFVLGALAYLQVPPLGGNRDEKWRAQ